MPNSTDQEHRAVSARSLRRAVRDRIYDMDGPQEEWYCKEVVIEALGEEGGASGTTIAHEQESESTYRIAYEYDGGEVSIAARENWTEVEQTWQPVEMERMKTQKKAHQSTSADRNGSPHHRAVTEANIRQSGEEDVVTVQFMTEQVARDGMVLDADGLDTEAFERNPVVLWSHGTDPRRGGEPIARASNIRQGGDGMLADVTFADDDFAQRIKRKVQDGFINAVSIGWRTEDIDRSGDAPTITRSDMTEFSFVAVPADTDALVQVREVGEDLRHRLATIENELEQLRAQATATSPSDEVGSEGTPSESSDADRGGAQEEGGGSDSTETEQYVPLSTLKKLKAQQGRQWTREEIRTELKKILGMA